MEEIEIRFQDGTTRATSQGNLCSGIFWRIRIRGKADRDVVTAKSRRTVLLDLQAPSGTREDSLEWIGLSSDQGLEVLRHSTSHVMAQAVQSLFPGGQNYHRTGH